MKSYRTAGGAGGDVVRVPMRGVHVLRDPMYNKGTAFTREERRALGLEGLLPYAVATLEEQSARAHSNVMRHEDPLSRYIALAALQDRNEVLYYHLLTRNLETFLPIVYTPTVGHACRDYSHIFRRGRGLWLSPLHRGRLAEVLAAAPFDDVRLIVVTDNERILGLGDQGAGGMGIPIGKLALYHACAGIHPSLTLPISLDVGTDNPALRDDPLYVGYRAPRMRGADYEAFVDEFVAAVKQVFPRALLQWEDFKKGNAFHLLDRHHDSLPSFNDDIQGTAAVAVAGLMSACRISGLDLTAQRVLIAGSGAAGIGIARLLRAAMRDAGMAEADVAAAIALTDTRGLLLAGRAADVEGYKAAFAWSDATAARFALPHDTTDLAAVIDAYQPTALIGTSGTPGLFTEDLVRRMAAHCARPVIFPLSNPTSASEAVPADLLHWTDGRALVATGSPFDPVRYGDRTVAVGQANNVFIFPGVGLGCLTAHARRVDDTLFAVACRTLADMVAEEDLASGRLFPPVSDLRRVARAIGVAVVRRLQQDGAAESQEDAEAAVDRFMWEPDYPRMVPFAPEPATV